MANGEEWFVHMAAAIKRRDRANGMIKRWTKLLAEAEETIADLNATSNWSMRADTVQAQEQEQVNGV